MKPVVRNILKKAVCCMAVTLVASVNALDIVRDGKSEFVIYHDVKAPKSVVQGAKELQH